VTDFRVLTLNIWNRLGPWDERLVAIRETLAAENPDVVGLQEVITTPHGDALDQGKAIAAGPPGRGYEVAFGASHGEGFSFGNGILSRWPIKRSQVFPLPGGEDSEPRSLLFAELEAPFGLLPVFVTHLAWRFHEGAVRQAQVLAVADKVAELAPATGLPAILLGDFNAEPECDEIRYLKGFTKLGRDRCVYFADAFAIAGDGSKGVTFSKGNPFAEPLREPDRRIDYIFVQRRHEDHRGEPLSARVCFDKPVNGVYPTDHFGVIATLRY
jgi:endonuclease/exonuclease/phosphatase family metal-dependent hydrolase